jgi:hypothetical protein
VKPPTIIDAEFRVVSGPPGRRTRRINWWWFVVVGVLAAGSAANHTSPSQNAREQSAGH